MIVPTPEHLLFFSAVAAALGVAASAAASGAAAAGTAIAGAAGAVGGAIGSAAGAVGSAIGSAGSAIGGALGGAGEAAAAAAPAATGVVETAAPVAAGVAEAVPAAASTGTSIASAAPLQGLGGPAQAGLEVFPNAFGANVATPGLGTSQIPSGFEAGQAALSNVEAVADATPSGAWTTQDWLEAGQMGGQMAKPLMQDSGQPQMQPLQRGGAQVAPAGKFALPKPSLRRGSNAGFLDRYLFGPKG